MKTFWVLTSKNYITGHCAPRSAASCEILNLIDTLHLTHFVSGQVKSILIQIVSGFLLRNLIDSLIDTFSRKRVRLTEKVSGG